MIKFGVFKYSKENGTPAEKLPNQIHPSTKESRYKKIMKLQKNIVEDKMSNYIGKQYEVLVERITENNKYYIGRTYMDIPDTDGVFYIKRGKEKEVIIGKFVKCKINSIKEYDMLGELI